MELGNREHRLDAPATAPDHLRLGLQRSRADLQLADARSYENPRASERAKSITGDAGELASVEPHAGNATDRAFIQNARADTGADRHRVGGRDRRSGGRRRLGELRRTVGRGLRCDRRSDRPGRRGVDARAQRVTAFGEQGMNGTRLHPVAWIVWAAGAGVVAFSTTNPFYLSLLIAVAWFVYASNRLDGPAGRSFRVFLIAGLSAMAIRTLLVFLGTVDLANVMYAALEGLRLATLLIVFGTFNAVTDPLGVVRLAPRRFHEPALAAALALSIAPRTMATLGRVREAQELRGIRMSRWKSLPALAVPVLETGMEEALTLAESMDARGHGSGRRTRYRPERWTKAAIVIAACAATAAVIFLGAGSSLAAALHPGTDPVVWPGADLWLLAAIGLLGVPAFLPRKTR
jgi:energy-coupling factor transport system permease protein